MELLKRDILFAEEAFEEAYNLFKNKDEIKSFETADEFFCLLLEELLYGENNKDKILKLVPQLEDDAFKHGNDRAIKALIILCEIKYVNKIWLYKNHIKAMEAYIKTPKNSFWLTKHYLVLTYIRNKKYRKAFKLAQSLEESGCYLVYPLLSYLYYHYKYSTEKAEFYRNLSKTYDSNFLLDEFVFTEFVDPWVSSIGVDECPKDFNRSNLSRTLNFQVYNNLAWIGFCPENDNNMQFEQRKCYFMQLFHGEFLDNAHFIKEQEESSIVLSESYGISRYIEFLYILGNYKNKTLDEKYREDWIVKITKSDSNGKIWLLPNEIKMYIRFFDKLIKNSLLPNNDCVITSLVPNLYYKSLFLSKNFEEVTVFEQTLRARNMVVKDTYSLCLFVYRLMGFSFINLTRESMKRLLSVYQKQYDESISDTIIDYSSYLDPFAKVLEHEIKVKLIAPFLEYCKENVQLENAPEWFTIAKKNGPQKNKVYRSDVNEFTLGYFTKIFKIKHKTQSQLDNENIETRNKQVVYSSTHKLENGDEYDFYSMNLTTFNYLKYEFFDSRKFYSDDKKTIFEYINSLSENIDQINKAYNDGKHNSTLSKFESFRNIDRIMFKESILSKFFFYFYSKNID